MHRRDVLRSLFFRTSTAKPMMNSAEPVTAMVKTFRRDTANSFISRWHLLPGTALRSEDLFSPDLQDWCVKDGELYCMKHGRDRMVQVLTHQLSDSNSAFKATFIFRFLNYQITSSAFLNYYCGNKNVTVYFQPLILSR